jgi:hypothetical protein
MIPYFFLLGFDVDGIDDIMQLSLVSTAMA